MGGEGEGYEGYKGGGCQPGMGQRRTVQSELPLARMPGEPRGGGQRGNGAWIGPKNIRFLLGYRYGTNKGIERDGREGSFPHFAPIPLTMTLAR